MPIVQHELEVVLGLHLLRDEASPSKSLLHQSNQHVKEDGNNVSRSPNEKDKQNESLRVHT